MEIEKIRFLFNSTLNGKNQNGSNFKHKYHSLNPTQIQIRLIRDLHSYRIRMMSLRKDQKKNQAI